MIQHFFYLEDSIFEINPILANKKVYLFVSDLGMSNYDFQILIQCFYNYVNICGFICEDRSFQWNNMHIATINEISSVDAIVLAQTYVKGIDRNKILLYEDFFCLKDGVDKEKIVIWGLGKIGRIVYDWMIKHNIEPAFLVDTNLSNIHGELKCIECLDSVVVPEGSCIDVAVYEGQEIIERIKNNNFINKIYHEKFEFCEEDAIYFSDDHRWITKDNIYALFLLNQRKNFRIFEGNRRFELFLELMGIKYDYITAIDDDNFANNIYDIFYNNAILILYENDREIVEKLEGLGLKFCEDFFVFGMGLYSTDLSRKYGIAIGHGHSCFEVGKEKQLGMHMYMNSKTAKKIVALGGSTTDGGRYSYNTWPYFLSKYFEEDINVINMGLTGYRSWDELKRFITGVVPMKVDAVIVYSGINDLFNETEYYNSYEKEIYDFFSRNLSKKVGYDIPVFVGDCPDFDKNANYRENSRFYGALSGRISAYRLWINNMRYINAIAEIHGIECYCFIQPNLYTKTIFNKNENVYMNVLRKSDYFKKAKKFYDELDEDNIKKYNFIYDLRKIFEQKDVYLDWAHVLERGNIIIAEEMAKIIKNKSAILH